MLGFPGDMMHLWGAPWNPRLCPGFRTLPHPQLHPSRTHMLEDQGDRGAEVLGVIVADKGGYAVWHQDGGDFPHKPPCVSCAIACSSVSRTRGTLSSNFPIPGVEISPATIGPAGQGQDWHLGVPNMTPLLDGLFLWSPIITRDSF